MSRAEAYARLMREAKAAQPPAFCASDDDHPIALIDERGYLTITPLHRVVRLVPSDVRRFITWLHATFDEKPL